MHQPSKDHVDPSVDEARIRTVEKELGGQIPDELRAHYQGAPRCKTVDVLPLDQVVARQGERAWQHDVLCTRYKLVRFCLLGSNTWGCTSLDNPLSGYVFTVAASTERGSFSVIDRILPDFESLINRAMNVFPCIDSYTRRDRKAYQFLRACLEGETDAESHERAFLIETMACLCPPHQWRDLIAYFDESPSAVRFLAQIYFQEMVPSLIALLSADTAAHHEVFGVLAKGVYVYPELEEEVGACLTRQGVNRSYLVDALSQIKRWPTLVDQW